MITWPKGLRLVAVAFVVAAVVHVAALVDPSRADGSPAWRHALFVLVNLLVAVGLWRRVRPRGFVVAFALLTAQQLASHGRDAWLAWRDAHRVDVASLIVVVAMPLVLWALVREAREARAARTSGP